MTMIHYAILCHYQECMAFFLHHLQQQPSTVIGDAIRTIITSVRDQQGMLPCDYYDHTEDKGQFMQSLLLSFTTTVAADADAGDNEEKKGMEDAFLLLLLPVAKRQKVVHK